MGNVIINASHVGTVTRSGSGYLIPANDEEMEIAKRAAAVTRQRWAEKRERQASKLRTKSKLEHSETTMKTARPKHRKSLPKEKLKPPTVVRRAITRHKNGDLNALAHQGTCHHNSDAAQKLGITDAEFERRIAALRRWNSESGS
jgi:hypothetical protein